MPMLMPPKNGATVRMYRLGHGDCFLIAFERVGGERPYYVMIDCGYKPGSPNFLEHGMKIGEVVKHLHDSCGGHLDLVILTHEHQDHLNGIWKSSSPYFKDFEIEEAWVAWTEDPINSLANDLRERHKDQLLGILSARRELALSVGEEDPTVKRLDSLLGMELGGNKERPSLKAMLAAAEDPEKSVNKQSMKFIKEKADTRRGRQYCYPGRKPLSLEGTAGIRAFIFGPPESEELIVDEDPHPGEGFPQGQAFSFVAAARSPREERVSPFSRHYFVPRDVACQECQFFADHYGQDDKAADVSDRSEVAGDAPWRRIDDEWLYSAEDLAIKISEGINNTCLVVGFELPKSKKVLFFAADAQRGNWYSWKDLEFEDGGESVSARDLLSRAVFYKVGHHGSHNATLFGSADDEHPNLGWMGLGSAASEFTAMISAVNEWALGAGWVHPLPSIKAALIEKAHGRVFQIDENVPEKPSWVSAAEWKKFEDRSVFDELYFDWQVTDD